MGLLLALFLIASAQIGDPTGNTGTTSSATGATGTGRRGPAGSEPGGSAGEGKAGDFIETDVNRVPPRPVNPPPPGVLGIGVPDYRPVEKSNTRDTDRGYPSGTVLELSTSTPRADPKRPRLRPR